MGSDDNWRENGSEDEAEDGDPDGEFEPLGCFALGGFEQRGRSDTERIEEGDNDGEEVYTPNVGRDIFDCDNFVGGFIRVGARQYLTSDCLPLPRRVQATLHERRCGIVEPIRWRAVATTDRKPTIIAILNGKDQCSIDENLAENQYEIADEGDGAATNVGLERTHQEKQTGRRRVVAVGIESRSESNDESNNATEADVCKADGGSNDSKPARFILLPGGERRAYSYDACGERKKHADEEPWPWCWATAGGVVDEQTREMGRVEVSM